MNAYPIRSAIKTSASVEPVTVAEVKDHVILQTDVDDALITAYTQAAREYVESQTGRTMISTTFTLYADGSPVDRSGAIYLPVGPLVSVSFVKVKDAAGDYQTVSTDYYGVDTASPTPRIVPLDGWPYVPTIFEGFTAEVVAGYGAAADDVPQTLRQAIRLLAAHWYEMRAATTEARIEQVPIGFDALLDLARSWRGV